MTTYDADELQLYADNTAHIYFGPRASVDRNLRRKRERGTYDHSRAVKAWIYVANEAARAYREELDPSARFPRVERRKAAQAMADEWLAEVEIEERKTV